VKLLIQHGVDVSKINKVGSTVLYLALQQGTPPAMRTLEEDTSFVQFLTTHGADILARDNDGDAPVHNVVGIAQHRIIRENQALIHLLWNEHHSAEAKNDPGATNPFEHCPETG